MKIEFDKAILWLIPYLYLVSVLYYWGYWGTLGVDVFNYYPVTDLIKGITSPLKTSIILSLFTGFYFLFIKIALENLRDKLYTYLLWLLGFAVLMFRIFNDYYTLSVHTEYSKKLFHLEIIEYVCMYASVLAAYYTNLKLKRTSRILDYARFSFICAALFLTEQSFCNGREHAIAIQFNKEFTYVIGKFTGKSVAFYKYLGKAGDYQVLETLDNYKKVVVPVADIKHLILEEYNLSNPGSLTRFRAHTRKDSTVH